jgi:glutamate synthase (NADPH/NADH) small chain
MISQEKVFSEKTASFEASRCLFCEDAPCIEACPAHIRIPDFINMIRSSNLKGARDLLYAANPLAAVCGDVCPSENYCEKACLKKKEDMSVAIRELHRFVTEHTEPPRIEKAQQKSNIKIAIAGGGPSGISCAVALSRLGYEGIIFEKECPLGVVNAMIPEYRVNNLSIQKDLGYAACSSFQIVQESIDSLKDLDEFDCIYLAMGLSDGKLGISGEDLSGIISARNFLKNAKKKNVSAGDMVAVIGGGNSAIDSARTSIRMGASKVRILYRRSLREMPALKMEVNRAFEEGVEFFFQTAPVAFSGDKKVHSVILQHTRLGEADETGRPRFIPEKGSEFSLPADTVIVAAGGRLGSHFPEIMRSGNIRLIVDNNSMTNISGVFAGGDIIRGEGTVVQAVQDGRHAAEAINHYLSRKL